MLEQIHSSSSVQLLLVFLRVIPGKFVNMSSVKNKLNE